MSLKAVTPSVVKAAKPKFLISGKSGVGKTMFALSFEKPYYIDTEGGAIREQYMKKLIDTGGAYFGKEQGSQDFKIIIQEIKELATTKHTYKTLIIDSFSKLYNVARAAAEESIGSDYARDKKEANKPTRQLIRWLDKIDMTCILVCHQADKWERHGKDVVYVGTTFDGFDKLEYELDLWLEILKAGQQRTFTVRKSRVQGFLEGAQHPLDYRKFCDLYGKDIVESEATPLIMATPEQVAEMKRLVEVVRLDQDTIDKWLTKAGAEDWDEMSSEQIEKAIKFIKAKIEPTKEPK